MRMLIMALLVTSCAGLSPTTIYAGSVTPVAGTCDPASEAVLTLRDKAIVFTPNSGTLLLRGELRGAAIGATLSLIGMDKAHYRVSFQGELTSNHVTGRYVTPRCRYLVSLNRQE